MRITFLGHSHVLVHIENPQGKTVHILVDSWLSDTIAGGYLERRPHVRIDHSLCPIDAVFLSRAHSSHLDPSFLRELWQYQRPEILLAETLEYLKPLLEEHLPGSRIVTIRDQDTMEWRGITLHGMVWQDVPQDGERDAMALCIDNEREVVYLENDTLPNGVTDDEDYLFWLLSRKRFETITYLATRHETEGLLTALDSRNADERRAFIREYRARAQQDIFSQYDVFLEKNLGYGDITSLPSFTRGFIGQGMAYSSELNADLAKIQPLPLQDILAWEKEAAAKTGRNFPQQVLVPGITYQTTPEGLQKISPMAGITCTHFLPIPDPTIPARKKYHTGPFDAASRDVQHQEKLILDILQNRFLPYWIGHSERSLKNVILSKTNRAYVVAVRFGNEKDFFTHYFRFALGSGRFEVSDRVGDVVDEDYWANDLEDFYEGRQEPYSIFQNARDPEKTYLLWICLSASLMNNDVLERRFRLQFERVRRG